MKSLILFAIFTLGLSLNEEDLALNYVEKHKDLAIAEMYRSGIPASITLAQALHESNNGRSELAIKANNHFGIKCKSYWSGKTFAYKDDDFKNGALIHSCFRAYDHHIASYVDHSNFLMGADHYAFLFDLEKTDYINWAHGLKKAGYATDPDYAIKLIKKIEKYQLYNFDYWTQPVKMNYLSKN